MDGYEIGRMGYLVLLLLAVGSYVIVENRRNLGKLMRQASAWVLLFIGAIAAYGLWQDVRPDLTPRQSLMESGQVVAERQFDGHFYLDLSLDGVPVHFVVDTGATDVVLSLADAQRVGIDVTTLTYSGNAMTANGAVRTAPTRVREVELEGIIDRNLRVYVNEGEMDGSLLGMAYLRRFSKIEIAGDRLILTR